MNEAENKVKEYIERAYDLIDKYFPRLVDKNGGIKTSDLYQVAQMLQREEHFNSNKE